MGFDMSNAGMTSSSPHNQMVMPPKDWQKMVGMVISVAIGCLDFDKRKWLMSLLGSRNDVVRHERWQKYKFIVNVTLSLFYDVTNVDAIRFRGTRVKFL
jgi:hypothetical protein